MAHSQAGKKMEWKVGVEARAKAEDGQLVVAARDSEAAAFGR